MADKTPNLDELLDDWWDHIFGDDEVTDEDEAWFNDKIGGFLDKLQGRKPPGKRRRRGEPSPPAGRPGRRADDSGSRRRSKQDNTDDSGYGLSVLFGSKESA